MKQFNIKTILVGMLFLITSSVGMSETDATPTSKENSLQLHYRAPTLTILKDTLAGETGFDIGYYLRPNLALQATVQTGIAGEAGEGATIGNIHHYRISIQHQFSRLFFYSLGIGNRKISRSFGSSNSTLEAGETQDADGHSDFDTYGSTEIITTGINAGMGMLKKFNHFNIGFYIVEVFRPIAVQSEKTKFNESYPENDKNLADLKAETKSLGLSSEFSLPRFIFGWSF